LVCKFPVAAEYGSIEKQDVLYEVQMTEVQQLVHRVRQVQVQAGQEENQLYWQWELLNLNKKHAVLLITECVGNLSK
jgi:hypothetical protein